MSILIILPIVAGPSWRQRLRTYNDRARTKNPCNLA
jgi:hypothetical protein